MLNLSIVVFALAAIGGLVLATFHFRDKNRPWPLAILHGLLGATGLILLAIPVLKGSAPALGRAALGLFVAAALGGFLLFAMHLQKKKLPSLVVIIHALAAVAAFTLLLVSVYS